MTEYIDYPLIKRNTVEKRMYQIELTITSIDYSTLIVLPTGLGKTTVALMVIASRLRNHGGKALVLSPTKPLVEQHTEFLKNTLEIPNDEIVTFTGSISPEQREKQWQDATIIVSTPQVIENDLLTKRISLENVVHITFDEAHRAVGNYAYTYIAEKYFRDAVNPLVLGMTASPGSSKEKINEVCQALNIEAVEIRTETDEFVAPYIQKKNADWRYLDLPEEIIEIKQLLEDITKNRMNKLSDALNNTGFNVPRSKNVSKKDLLGLQSALQSELKNEPDQGVYIGLSILAELMKVNHALEVLETQGVDALRKYYDNLYKEVNKKSCSKASVRLIEDPVMTKVKNKLDNCTKEHPKLETTEQIVSNQLNKKPDSRIIVFTNFRSTADMLTKTLQNTPGVKPVKFVGQSSKDNDKGLSQKQQVEIIEKFKKGTYNVVVSTSVAEEGLDIPSTDMVLFYEPVSSEIRAIQRKGRTARKQEGNIVVLITRKTRDEAYYWSSVNKEQKMQENMEELQQEFAQMNLEQKKKCDDNQKPQTSIDEYNQSVSKTTENDNNNDTTTDATRNNGDDVSQTKTCTGKTENNSDTEQKPLVFVDHRETKSKVVQTLDKLDVDFRLKTMEVGDYVASNRVGIERKSTDDFVSSLINKTLFDQITRLSQNYDKPSLVIEGDDLYETRQIDPRAIRGTLISLNLHFNVDIYYTKDGEETAYLINQIAKTEQFNNNRIVSLHGKKATQVLSDQQEYVVSSIADIGPKAARNLLKHFGTVEQVMNASYDDLLKVSNVGPKTASRIREVIGSDYKA